MHQDENSPVFSRRSVLTAAAIVPITALNSDAAPAEQPNFSAPQLRLIEALVDRLIPSDENGPGARESGVHIYIDRSFTGYLAHQKSTFTAGLEAIDALAHTRHGALFADLDAAQKDELLTILERNDAPGFQPGSRAFFYRLRQLTLEGMFGDPFYGGNRNFAGWDLIRYPGPRMAVSPDEQKIKVAIKPLRVSARGGQHGG